MNNFNVKIKEFVDAKEGDVLVFDGKKWVPASIDTIVAELTHRIAYLEQELKDAKEILSNTIHAFAEKMDEQKKQIANILKGLVD